MCLKNKEAAGDLLKNCLLFWVVDSMMAEAPLHARCTCSKGLKLILYKHVLGLSICLGYLKVSAPAKMFHLAENKNMAVLQRPRKL